MPFQVRPLSAGLLAGADAVCACATPAAANEAVSRQARIGVIFAIPMVSGPTDEPPHASRFFPKVACMRHPDLRDPSRQARSLCFRYMTFWIHRHGNCVTKHH